MYAVTSDWSGTSATAALEAQDFEGVAAAVCSAIDTKRDPRSVNWCIEFGYRRGHVPVLFYLTKNALRYGKGRVPSCEDVAFGVKCALLLLLRTAQDVISCRVDLAKSDRDFIYEAMVSYVRQWVLRWHPSTLPGTRDLEIKLRKWLSRPEFSFQELPLPTWATCFNSRVFGLSWGKPEPHDTASFKRSETIVSTRDMVTQIFLTTLHESATLDEFLARGISLFWV
jgi:hypothetical protein